MPLVEQELHILPKNLSSLPILAVSCYSIFSFLCNVLHILVCPFVISLFWPLHCLSFDLWLLITPLVPSSFSIYMNTLFVLLYFLLRPLCCLFFFDIRILMYQMYFRDRLKHICINTYTMSLWGRRCCHRMVVRFMTAYAISAYHH